MADISNILKALRPADIIFMADNTLLSRYIRIKSGSFRYSHVAIADGAGGIYTTSATVKHSFLPPFTRWLYGSTKAATFLHGKSAIAVVRYTTPRLGNYGERIGDGQNLTNKQATGILEVCKGMTGEDYPIGKLVRMVAVGDFGNGVDCVDYCKLPDSPDTKVNRICTEGVAHAYLQGAGIELNVKAHNANPSGYDLVELYYSANLVEVARV